MRGWTEAEAQERCPDSERTPHGPRLSPPRTDPRESSEGRLRSLRHPATRIEGGMRRLCSREGGRRLTRPNRCDLSEARHRGAGGAVTRGPPAPANSASGSRVDAAARVASAKTQAGRRAGSRVPRPTCPRPGVYTVRPVPSPPRREPRVHGEGRGLPAAILLTKPPRVTLKLSSSPPDHCLLKRVGAKKHVPFGPGQGWELSSSPQNPR